MNKKCLNCNCCESFIEDGKQYGICLLRNNEIHYNDKACYDYSEIIEIDARNRAMIELIKIIVNIVENNIDDDMKLYEVAGRVEDRANMTMFKTTSLLQNVYCMKEILNEFYDMDTDDKTENEIYSAFIFYIIDTHINIEKAIMDVYPEMWDVDGYRN